MRQSGGGGAIRVADLLSAAQPRTKPPGAPAGRDLDDRLRIIRTGYQRSISHDPVKRAAWDLLAGPGSNWTEICQADAYRNPQKHEWHMHHPDMILPISAGADNVDCQDRVLLEPASRLLES